MSSPVLNSTDFALVADSFPTSPEVSIQPVNEAVLTLRAMIAVALLGSGFWFVLWKLALHFWMLR